MAAAVSLAHRLEGFAGARVLVLGDVMLDRYVYGRVERVSPEAPVPVLKIDHEQAMPGGAGNVARNIAALGARAVLIGVIGEDEAGRQLQALLAADSRIVTRLALDPSRPTTQKTRFMAERHQLLRADAESAAPAAAAVAAELVQSFTGALAEVDVVVLSDYAKGVLDEPTLAAVIAAARSANKPIIADPKRSRLAAYRGVDLIAPNHREMAAATGLPCEEDAAVAAAAAQVIGESGVGAVLVTRGERGMSLVQAGGQALHLPAEAREVFDVSGAGDTVVATLGVALAAGADLAEAARLANLAGGIVVGKVGTAVVHPADLAAALRSAAVHSTEVKILPREAALDRVAGWRRRGERIGFTNGCFDLIHPGHVSLLTQARAACDRLVVAINSDESVRRLKGAGRPVQNETARAIVLASLAAVDLVVVFDEDTPIPLLQALHPDVLVKGADYALDQVVGGDIVRAYGGKVLLAELAPGHSTSRTIAKMTG